jgi:zinc transport system substrate-binding protein
MAKEAMEWWRFSVIGLAGAIVMGSAGAAGAARPRVPVVAAFYPVAYAASEVGGNRVAVTNLTPAGAEPHDLELTPKQMDVLLDAKVAFVMGHRFQPAVEKSATERSGVTVTLLDRLPIDAGAKRVREGDPNALDPHVWLDPVLMQDIVRQVQAALAKADPNGAATYANNADALVGRLGALDERYSGGLAHCERHEIVTSHEAFGYLAKRYGLIQQGVAGLSPDAEPDAKRIGELADLVRRDGVTVVFTETLVSPRIADTLAREAGVKTDTLDPLEGLTDRDAARGDDYFTVMDQNLRKLQSALACSSG